MKYEVIKCGQGKDGRSFYPVGKTVELDESYAKHLVKRGILKQCGATTKKVEKKTKSTKKETADMKPEMETPEE